MRISEASTIMVELSKLALDIAVPPKVLARRGGVTISEDIVTFLHVSQFFFDFLSYFYIFN